MSVKNYQATLKSCMDHKSNALFTLCSESETMVCDTDFLGLTASHDFQITKTGSPSTQMPFWLIGGYFKLS